MIISTTGPELVFGLVGAVGCDLDRVSGLIEQHLKRVAYNPKTLRLSSLISNCAAHGEVAEKARAGEDKRIRLLMDAGDALRRVAKRGDAVALLAISAIRAVRQEQGVAENTALPRHAYILRSLKHPAEVQTLRAIYGEAFVAVSVYMPRTARLRLLSERIKRSAGTFDAGAYNTTSQELIDADEKEVGDEFGQNVRETFPEADVFLDASDDSKLPEQVQRMVDILFQHPFQTPTIDEYSLFHAKATALRSADLSRQVGAVITTSEGEFVSAGCNEVPKAGGGAVWAGRDKDRPLDRRDFKIGHDTSAAMKYAILLELFQRMGSAGWLYGDLIEGGPKRLVQQALYDPKDREVLAGAMVTSIIEFGRMVHAEMSAITDAARRGFALKGTKLYCTTFPCHMCARHIIASGIEEVIYIEPYPKSKAQELYEGMLVVDHEGEADEGATQFRPFVGVAPRRYLQFFEMPKRKDARGHVIEWLPLSAQPRVKHFSTYLELEAFHSNHLAENASTWGIVAEDGP